MLYTKVTSIVKMFPTQDEIWDVHARTEEDGLGGDKTRMAQLRDSGVKLICNGPYRKVRSEKECSTRNTLPLTGHLQDIV